eukprot:TRINITY_DN21253_c0_g1_i2.p1 TRINITY_DN21253_c0_g1~~TRINITY_DN21253_c0_g1_i2.p1  ORF type:complete len:968 (+),score=57.63 TRINITY_DN21253_c0_g1_i2:80-2983(+)
MATVTPVLDTGAAWETFSVAVLTQGGVFCVAATAFAGVQFAGEVTPVIEFYLVAAFAVAFAHAGVLFLDSLAPSWDTGAGTSAPRVVACMFFGAVVAAVTACVSCVHVLWMLGAAAQKPRSVDDGGEKEMRGYLSVVKREVGLEVGTDTLTPATASLLRSVAAEVPEWAGIEPPQPEAGLCELTGAALRTLADHETCNDKHAAALWLRIIACAADGGDGVGDAVAVALATTARDLDDKPSSGAAVSDESARRASLASITEAAIPPSLQIDAQWEAAALMAALGYTSAAALCFKAAATAHSPDLLWLTGGGDSTVGPVEAAGEVLAAFAQECLGCTDRSSGRAQEPATYADALTICCGTGAPHLPEPVEVSTAADQEHWDMAVRSSNDLGPRAVTMHFSGQVPPSAALRAESLSELLCGSALTQPQARVWAFHHAHRSRGCTLAEWCADYRSGAGMGEEGHLKQPPTLPAPTATSDLPDVSEVVDLRFEPTHERLGVLFMPDRVVVSEVLPGSPAAEAGVQVGWRVFAVDGGCMTNSGVVALALSRLSYASVVVSFLRPQVVDAPVESTPNLAVVATASHAANCMPWEPLPSTHVRLYVAPTHTVRRTPVVTGSSVHPFACVSDALAYARKHSLHIRCTTVRVALLPGVHCGPVVFQLEGCRLLVLEGCDGATIQTSDEMESEGGLVLPAGPVVVRRLVLKPSVAGAPALHVSPNASRVCVADCVFLPPPTPPQPMYWSDVSLPVPNGGYIVAELPDLAQKSGILQGLWLPAPAAGDNKVQLRRAHDCTLGLPASATTLLTVSVKNHAIVLSSCGFKRIRVPAAGAATAQRVLLLADEPSSIGLPGAPRTSSGALLLSVVVAAGLLGDTNYASCSGFDLGGPCAPPIVHVVALVAAILGLGLCAFFLRERVVVFTRLGSSLLFAASGRHTDTVDRVDPIASVELSRPGSGHSQTSETMRLRQETTATD